MKIYERNKEGRALRSKIMSDEKYIYSMGLVGISPERAKKDIINIKKIKSRCSWKGHCKKCGMVHIMSNE